MAAVGHLHSKLWDIWSIKIGSTKQQISTGKASLRKNLCQNILFGWKGSTNIVIHWPHNAAILIKLRQESEIRSVIGAECDIFLARLNSQKPEVSQLLYHAIFRVINVGFNEILVKVSIKPGHAFIYSAHLNEAVDPGFPTTIKCDKVTRLSIKLSTHKTGEGRRRLRANQILLRLLCL